jgi:DNA polymerase-3 subunit delta
VSELVDQGLEPVYVLHSEHPVLVERAIAEIRDAAVPAPARAFNYDVVEGSIRTPASGQRIRALCETLPMMAQRRMVFVRDLSALPADEAEPLIDYFAKPNPSTVLVAVASKLDKRLKLFAVASKKGYVHVLEAPRQLAPWVRAEAQAHGVKIDGAAITRLVDTVGSDLSRLALTVEQLGLYAHGRAVTSDDVDDLIADTRERSVFELTDAIGAADRVRSLAAVASLCDQRESAVGVVVMLARYVRQLALVHTLRANDVPRGEWASKLGVPPFVVDKLLAQARGYSRAALADATRQLAEADRAFKGDVTLDGRYAAWTGPQMKALGRELGERVILERVVDGIVRSAATSRT